MRKPRPADFQPSPKPEKALEPIDLTGITPIKPPPKQTHDIPSNGVVVSRHHDTMVDTTVSPIDILETVRKAVKKTGKEAATHRFTLQEKETLAELIFNFKKQGIKTSENEITRIALNYIMTDFQRRGDESILKDVLQQLNN